MNLRGLQATSQESRSQQRNNTMLLSLPTELIPNVIANLSPRDVKSLLAATGETLTGLFNTYTNSSSLEESDYFFNQVPMNYTVSPMDGSRESGYINLIELVDFGNMDKEQFFEQFEHRTNVIVVRLTTPPDKDIFDSQLRQIDDPQRLNEFLVRMLPRSQILLCGLDKGFTLDLGLIKLTHRLSIADSPTVDVDGGITTHPLDCTNVQHLVMQHSTQEIVDKWQGFDVTPYDALVIGTTDPCVLHDKKIKAQVVLLMNLKSMRNVEIQSKRLTALYPDDEDEELDMDILIAPNLEFIGVRYTNIFPKISNIQSERIEEAWFKRELEWAPTYWEQDRSMDCDFSFLKSLKKLSITDTNGPLVKCPSFEFLEELIMEINTPLPLDFHLQMPSLKTLRITGSSGITAVPRLEAPELVTYSLVVRNPNNGKASIENLPEVLRYYKKLISLELTLRVPVLQEVSDGIGEYLHTHGSNLKTLTLMGTIPQAFSDPQLSLPILETLELKGGVFQTDLEMPDITIGFTAPGLRTLTFACPINSLALRGFPSLQTFTCSNSVPELRISETPALRSLAVEGRLGKLKADSLGQLKVLSYNLGGEDTRESVEDVTEMNSCVVRRLKRVR